MKPITTTILAFLISSATYAQNTLSTASNSLQADILQQEIVKFTADKRIIAYEYRSKI